MEKYIAEIAGKDSIAAVVKFIKENKDVVIVPTIVYTGTEYGDKNSYYNSIDFLRKEGEKSGIEFEKTLELQNGALWNVLCARYQYLINGKYGFYTPCIACHLFTHLLRIPCFREFEAGGIITGERHSHQGKLKANQHPLTIERFTDIFEANGIKLFRPLVDIEDTECVNSQIQDETVVAHANDLKCVFSGNMKGFELKDNLDKLEFYLDDFIVPVGNFCVSKMITGEKDWLSELEKVIEEILK